MSDCDPGSRDDPRLRPCKVRIYDTDEGPVLDRARNHATDTCHWCPNLWIIAIDTTVTTWHACWDHIELLPPWNSESART